MKKKPKKIRVATLQSQSKPHIPQPLPHVYRVGDKARVTRSKFSGIAVGDIDIIDCRLPAHVDEHGYGLSFTKQFQDATNKWSLTTRVCFFTSTEIEPYYDKDPTSDNLERHAGVPSPNSSKATG